MSRRRARVEESSGNVFADIGSTDAEKALAKSRTARRIGEAIRDRGLTQPRAAELMAVDQSEVSAILTGRLSGYSMERLARLLARLGGR
jgi:predicted XRE-type DNA-binding protein